MSKHTQNSSRWIIPAFAILIAGGCVAPSRTAPFGTVEDSTAYAPQFRAYSGPTTTVTPQATQSLNVQKPVITEPDLGTTNLNDSQLDGGDEIIMPEPETPVLPTPDDVYLDEQPGPLLTAPPALTAPSVPDEREETASQPVRLLLDIVRPEQATQGGDVRYEVTIRNETDTAAEDVEVYCTFEYGLQFPGKAEKELRRNIGRVEANESQTMSLVLVGRQLGRHCAQFTVTSSGKEVVWKSVCTDIKKQALSLDIVGPDRRNVGSRAEYTITMTNVSDSVLKGVQTKLTFDDVLVPKEATEGAVEGEDNLSWNLGDLQPGEALQLQVEFECVHAADVAKFEVESNASGGVMLRRETGLEIVPPRGVLDLKLRDQGEPAAVNGELSYIATIQNYGFQDARNVQIEVLAPSGIKLLKVAATLDGKTIDLPHQADRGKWTFDTVRKFPAESTLQLRITAQGVTAGDHKVAVSIKSDLDSKPNTVEEWTTINAK